MSAAPSTPRPRWQISNHLNLRVVRFGTEAVVFNPLSWETHLLNETAAHVVESLREAPQDVEELAATLVHDLDPESLPDVYAGQIAALMNELEAFGLVVRAQPEANDADR